ncbi:MAG: cell division protein FtsQ/DivIB [Bacteroidota bacterium]
MKQHHRLGALVLVLVPIVALLVGVAMSPAVGVSRVTIVAPTTSLGEAVRQQMRVPAQASMLFYPVNHVTDQVKRCFRVKDVAVDRVSPHELLVTVTARQPFAALLEGDTCTILSRDGICLYRQAAPPPKFPIMVGMTTAPSTLGAQVDPERMQWALEVLAGATKVGLQDGLQVDLSQVHHITVKTSNGVQGVLGNVNHLARKMAIVGRVVEQLRSQGKQPKRVDVSTPETPIWTVS